MKKKAECSVDFSICHNVTSYFISSLNTFSKQSHTFNNAFLKHVSFKKRHSNESHKVCRQMTFKEDKHL